MPNDPAANIGIGVENPRHAGQRLENHRLAATATTEAAPQATGTGTIKGRFVFEGQAAAPAAISVTKDVEVCGQHHLMDESLLVDSKGGLANAVSLRPQQEFEIRQAGRGRSGAR